MKIIALYSIKGGVGKTAACVNLAYLSTIDGGTTLIVDLDPQGAATFYFRIRASKNAGKRGILEAKKKRNKAIRATDFDRLDLMPSVLAYRRMDIWLNKLKHRKRMLEAIFQTFEKEYDYLFIDCPPNITLVSENIFRAADVLLTPVIPTTLSMLTLETLVRFFEEKKISKTKIIPFFSMVERRKKMHKSIVEARGNSRVAFLESAIPYSSEVEKMGVYRQPIFNSAPHSPAALAYLELWENVKKIRVDSSK